MGENGPMGGTNMALIKRANTAAKLAAAVANAIQTALEP